MLIIDSAYLDTQMSEADKRNVRPVLEFAIDNNSRQMVGFRIVFKEEKQGL